MGARSYQQLQSTLENPSPYLGGADGTRRASLLQIVEAEWLHDQLPDRGCLFFHAYATGPRSSA